MICRHTVISLALLASLVSTPSFLLAQDEFEALQQPSRELARQILEANGRKVAVVDLSDLSGRVLELGRAIAEEVASLLVRTGKPLQIVDRLSMTALLREHKLTVTGLIDPKTTKEFGRISGVDVLVTGTITPLGNTVRITLKAIDTQTATILGSTTVSMQRSTGIDRLLQLEATGTTDSPVEHAGDYEGSTRFERYRNLDVRLESLQHLKSGDVVAALRLRNAKPDSGPIAIALKAEGSGGIADYWKFFPRATASMTDSQGNEYGTSSVTGIGFAREESDWTFLRTADEVTVTLNFSGGSRFSQGGSFTIVIELWYVDRSGDGQPMTVTFRNVRPK